MTATKQLQDQIKAYKVFDTTILQKIAFSTGIAERNIQHFLYKKTTDTALEIQRAFNNILNGGN